MRTFIRHFLLSVMALLLIACGGGGGSTSTPAPTPSAPAAPTGLTAIATNGQVSLSWSVSSSATAYHVKRALVTGGAYTEIAAPTATAFIDSGLTNGTTYYYVVTASNANGESANSAEASAVPSTDLPVLADNDPTQNYLGMNVWFAADWDGAFAFADAMKTARPWRNADWTGDVATDEYGWPLADASTVVFTGTGAQVNGTYKLIFNGLADVSLLWVGGSVTNKVYDAATNTTTADVTFAAGDQRNSLGLILRNTQRTASSATKTGFTNLRLYRPGKPADGSVVYNPHFLNAIKKVHVVRMMDWTATNGNLVQHWADRMTPKHFSRMAQSYKGPGGLSVPAENVGLGVALEHQIRLCNEANVDCWINIPPAADDDFVRNMALTLRYGSDGTNPYTSTQTNPVYPPLKPGLRVYLEYSNEIWNSAGGFWGFHVIEDIINSLANLLVTDHPVQIPSGGHYDQVWRYPAFRTAQASDIFRTVYGDASMMNRVRPILMTQQGDGQATLSTALVWLERYGKRQSPERTVNSYIYGAGGSGYYGPMVAEADRGNANVYFSAANFPPAENLRNFELDATWAAAYGVKRIAYEGGPSLDGYTETQANSINLDPRMQTAMIDTHNAWSARGGDLLVYYTLSGDWKWGFTPDIFNLDTPKFRALDQLRNTQRAAYTYGQLLPGTIAAANGSKIGTAGNWNGDLDGETCLNANRINTWIAYPAYTASATTGSLSLRGASGNEAVTIKVSVNSKEQGQVVLPASNYAKTTSSTLTLNLPKGKTLIRLDTVNGANADWGLCSIQVE
ncbi:hypothetical protein OPU71_12455 [Niveibacterium sp. 24ML]|uniref:hypothetical protein n=1 Tax=Niveibacterium sp. 24ML TaxID=2985512 RepID=UPI0022720A64|nr:hypothetical protein [Niveibacterium sp. 24ML]MCX9156937.1 hypothetical protein [Niveibacterium sp. 24ML]